MANRKHDFILNLFRAAKTDIFPSIAIPVAHDKDYTLKTVRPKTFSLTFPYIALNCVTVLMQLEKNIYIYMFVFFLLNIGSI